LVWLDPMPSPQDIGKAYANYYTHAVVRPSTSHPLKRLFHLAKQGYWHSQYQYPPATNFRLAAAVLGALLRFSPIHRRETDADVRFLPAVPHGRLLDVGCGSGDWLLAMSQRGWRVEGLDFDSNAVAVARSRGLKVATGALEAQQYNNSTFDAVTLSHVIEHVPDPVACLRECARVLKPGGRLVLLTPNADSLGHRIFGDSWRGLEPPRHLHVFSLHSMQRALQLAGFKAISVLPFVVTSVVYESILLRWGRGDFAHGAPRHRGAKLLTQLFKLLEICVLPWNGSAGDCVVASAIKE
jgi:2-polyprenyl-3-methyl-5-hydroxy-6-metoxy-1,4-benzoquinol methylase